MDEMVVDMLEPTVVEGPPHIEYVHRDHSRKLSYLVWLDALARRLEQFNEIDERLEAAGQSGSPEFYREYQRLEEALYAEEHYLRVTIAALIPRPLDDGPLCENYCPVLFWTGATEG
jgi:hypothetical protein